MRLEAHIELPEDMTIAVHYSTAATVNAFATLGGHVVLHRGLIDELESENALAMVLAHEMAHVQLRHPIVAASRGLTVALALGSIAGFAENAAASQLVQWLGVTSAIAYNRDQERAADALAAEMLIAEYGHLEGAADLFKALGEPSGDGGLSGKLVEFAATHPALEERIAALEEQARAAGLSGTTRPLNL